MRETGRLVGSFKFHFDKQQWEWSEAVAAMHGYGADEITPTTDLVLAHKHPDDRVDVQAVLERSFESGEPFWSRHRIVDTHGRTREVLVVGDRLVGGGKVIGSTGFYVDLTDTHERAVQAGIDDAVAALAESRAAIEQAKGMLMLVYRISAAQAFEVLRWRSQVTNSKLRVLAEQIVIDTHSMVVTEEKLRQDFDQLLLTAHERSPVPDFRAQDSARTTDD